MRRILVVLMLGGVLIAAVACGSSKASPTKTSGAQSPAAQSGTPAGGVNTPVPGSTGVTISGSPAPTLTPTPFGAPQETAVAQGPSVALKDYTDPAGHFVVGLPEGWTIVPGKNAVRAILAGDPIAGAILGVSCTPNAPVDALVLADQTEAKNFGIGNMTLDKETSTTVAGVTARRIPWKGGFKGVTYDNVYVYFEKNGCGWRVILNTYPSEKPADMQAVLQRVIDSLRLS